MDSQALLAVTPIISVIARRSLGRIIFPSCTSGPIPAFACPYNAARADAGIKRTTSNFMFLVVFEFDI
jgi:hypothetical protein